MRKKWLVVAFVAALIGVIIASISISEYFHIQKAGLEENSFCTINELINCDIINASSFATLLGIPTAAWGLLFYIVVGSFSLFIRLSKKSCEAALSFIWGLSIVAFLWTIRMAYVSATVLNAICLTCIGQYIINLFILLSLTFGSELALRDRFKRLFSKKILPHVVTTVIIFGIGYVFALSAVRGATPKISEEDINAAVSAHFRQSLYDIKPEALKNSPVWGNADAKVTVVEFSDFQCPFCRIAAFNVRPYLHEFRDKVKFVYVNYPLDNSCNQYMDGPMHSQSCLAAKAGVCASEKGVFWEYHDDVFKNQPKISRQMLLNLAKKHGLDADWFNKCIDNDETLKRVKDDIETAHHVYLSGTPSIIVNQKILKSWRSPDVLRKVIREEIKKSYRNN